LLALLGRFARVFFTRLGNALALSAASIMVSSLTRSPFSSTS
jgi:hypothetical protein